MSHNHSNSVSYKYVPVGTYDGRIAGSCVAAGGAGCLKERQREIDSISWTPGGQIVVYWSVCDHYGNAINVGHLLFACYESLEEVAVVLDAQGYYVSPEIWDSVLS